jgi:hypothetical protein
LQTINKSLHPLLQKDGWSWAASLAKRVISASFKAVSIRSLTIFDLEFGQLELSGQ